MSASDPASWLLLIHQFPPHPAYLRVKTGRQLAKVGAIAIKNSVYALPDSAETREDFYWIAKEIESEGGEVSISVTKLLHGLDDEAMHAQFRKALDSDYAEFSELVHKSVAGLKMSTESGAARREYHRLRRRLNEICARDFFHAPLRTEAETALKVLRNLFQNTHSTDPAKKDAMSHELRNRTWVTRAGVQVDRIASAWLIKRFIDPEARFRFVRENEDPTPSTHLRFDMFQADFTHEGDACTFEVLLRKMELQNDPLTTIGEIVHDIDLKDSKFGHPETAGLACLMAGIVTQYDRDETRFERGAALLDDLYSSMANQSANP